MENSKNRSCYSRRKTVGKKLHRINYRAIAAIISALIVDVINTKDTSETGVWSKVAKHIEWPDTPKSRKYLYVMYKTNRMNLASMVSEFRKSKRTVETDKTVDVVEDDTGSNDKLQFRRRKKVKRLSSNWVTKWVRKTVYCICKTKYKSSDKRPMLMCKVCKEWYHFDCIGLRASFKHKSKDLVFTCGLPLCSGQTELSLKRGSTKIVLYRQLPVSKDLDSSVAAENQASPFPKKLSHLSTDSFGGFSKDSMEAAIGTSIPDTHYTYQLPDTSQFNITDDTWNNLQQSRINRSFRRGYWQKAFICGLRKTNPYCVLMFKRHQVSTATKRKLQKSKRIFAADAYCKFSGCPVTVKLEMFSILQVTCSWRGNVRHAIEEKFARPIRGQERDELKEKFKYGQKPFNEYLERISSKGPDELVAGNFDSLGADRTVYRKISSEAIHPKPISDNTWTNLLQLSAVLKSTLHAKMPNLKIPGFIQNISIDPICILYWSEAGLRIWHDLSNRDVVFWDATGNVVRKYEGAGPLLYYELVCRHPTKNEPAIPVSSMLSSAHSEPMIHFWLRSFRRSEKILFGHNKLSRPRLIISDRSLVFLVSSLTEFNGESVSAYLERCYRIVTGSGSDVDLSLTNPHACASHVMKDFKQLCKDTYRSNFEFGMYCCSLLLNAQTMSEATEILCSLSYILLSKQINAILIEHSKVIQCKIQNIGIQVDIKTSTPLPITSEVSGETSTLRIGRLSEEEFISKAVGSPFAKWSKAIVENTNAEIIKHESLKSFGVNRRYGSTLLDKLLKNWLPTLPFWSGLMMGDLGRHGQSAEYQDLKTRFEHFIRDDRNFMNPTKCNATTEERFRVLKHIGLLGRRKHTLEEFSFKLFTHASSLLSLSSAVALKRKVQPKISSKTLQETWNKSVPEKSNEVLTVGKYQKPPEKDIPVIRSSEPVTPASFKSKRKKVKQNFKHSKAKKSAENRKKEQRVELLIEGDLVSYEKDDQRLLPQTLRAKYQKYAGMLDNVVQSVHLLLNDCIEMPNITQNCWFNAMMQATHKCNFVFYILDNWHLQFSKVEKLRPVLKIWENLQQSEVGAIPNDSINFALETLANANFSRYQQQDVAEYFQSIISLCMEEAGDVMQMVESVGCFRTDCLEPGTQILPFFSLQIPIQNLSSMYPVDVMNLLRSYFTEQLFENCKCDKCGNPKKGRLMVTLWPETLVLELKRYSFERSFKKRRDFVTVNNLLNVKEFSIEKRNVFYEFHSAIVHSGNRPTSGHYTAVIRHGEILIEHDDTRARRIFKGAIEQDVFFVVYHKVATWPCKLLFSPVCSFLSKSAALKRIKNLCNTGAITISYRKFHLLELILTIGDADPQNIIVATENDEMIDTLHTVMSEIHTTYCVSEVIDGVFKEYILKQYESLTFEHLGFSFVCCCQDGNSMIKTQTILTVPDHLSLSTDHFSERLKQSLVNLCSCYPKTPGHVTCKSLGSSIILHFRSFSQCDAIPTEYNFSCMVGDIYPTLREYFELISILVYETGTEHVVALKQDTHIVLCCNQNVETYTTFENIIHLLVGKEVFLLLNRTETSRHCPPVSIPSSFSDVIKTVCRQNTDLDILKWEIPNDEKEIVDSFVDSVTIHKITLSARDFEALKGLEFTDKLIDAYLIFVQKLHHVSQSYVFPASWYADRLECSDFDQLLGKTPIIFDHSVVLIPCNLAMKHWVLIAIMPTMKQIVYCDPLGKFDERVLGRLFKYICFEYFMSHKSQLDYSRWQIIDACKAPDFPQQRDGLNCGPYACIIGESIFKGVKLPKHISASDFLNIRKYLAINLLKEAYRRGVNDSTYLVSMHDVIFNKLVNDHIINIISKTNVPSLLFVYRRHLQFLNHPGHFFNLRLAGFGRHYVDEKFERKCIKYLIEKYLVSVLPSSNVKDMFSAKTPLFKHTPATSSLNQICRKNSYAALKYITEILWKEVLIFLVQEKLQRTYQEVNEDCGKTEVDFHKLRR